MKFNVARANNERPTLWLTGQSDDEHNEALEKKRSIPWKCKPFVFPLSTCREGSYRSKFIHIKQTRLLSDDRSSETVTCMKAWRTLTMLEQPTLRTHGPLDEMPFGHLTDCPSYPAQDSCTSMLLVLTSDN